MTRERWIDKEIIHGSMCRSATNNESRVQQHYTQNVINLLKRHASSLALEYKKMPPPLLLVHNAPEPPDWSTKLLILRKIPPPSKFRPSHPSYIFYPRLHSLLASPPDPQEPLFGWWHSYGLMDRHAHESSRPHGRPRKNRPARENPPASETPHGVSHARARGNHQAGRMYTEHRLQRISHMRVPYTARDHYLTFKMLEIIQQHHFTKIWSFAIDRYPIGEGRKQKVDLARILLQDEPKFQDQFDFHWFNDRYASSLSKKLGTLERECKEGVLRPERLRVAVQICLDIALPQLHRDIRDGLALARPHTDKAAAQAAAARGVGSEADGLLDTVSFAPGTSTCVNAKASKTETAGGTPEPPRVGGPATGPKRARDDDIEEDGLSVKRARAQAPTETTASAPESSRLRATRWGRSPGRR